MVWYQIDINIYHYSALFYISTDVPFYAFMYFVFFMYRAREHCDLALYKLINYYHYQYTSSTKLNQSKFTIVITTPAGFFWPKYMLFSYDCHSNSSHYAMCKVVICFISILFHQWIYCHGFWWDHRVTGDGTKSILKQRDFFKFQ